MYRLMGRVVLIFLVTGVLRAQQPAENKTPDFEPIQVRHFVEPVYPVNSIANGVVILKVVVTPAGAIYSVDVLHGIESLTKEAEKTVRKWGFAPAKLNGRRVESSTIVAFAFCNSMGSPIAKTAESKTEEAMFDPIQVVSADSALYPVNSVALAGPRNFATVVLKVTVNEKGEVSHVDVLHGVQTLTEPAEETVQTWKLLPARLQGEAVSSSLAASFTFQAPYVPPR
jgi:outer membrane biosynthesis protein TonB